MTLDEFVSKYNGKGIDFDHAYGFQCMDVAEQYVTECLGNPKLGGTNAIDCWTNYQTNLYDKIENTPSGVPQKGDIVIWGSGVGQYGHIAIFLSGDSANFQSFEQNWPLQVDSNGNGLGVAHQQAHNYNAVLGWLHSHTTVAVDSATFEKLVTKSTAYDQFAAAGYASLSDVNNKIEDLQTNLKISQDTATKLSGDKDQLESQITALQGTITSFQSETSQDKTTIDGLNAQNLVLTTNCSGLSSQVTDLKAQLATWETQGASPEILATRNKYFNQLAKIAAMAKGNWFTYLVSRGQILSILSD